MKFFSTLPPADPSPNTREPPVAKPTRKHAASASTSNYYATQQNAQRKRVKRQTAGALVAGVFGGGGGQAPAQQHQQQQQQPPPAQHQQPSPPKITPSGKKSTAQPRPAVTVPPRGIGPVHDPDDNDVLCGRGGRINSHVGNVRFRRLVAARKPRYLAPTTKKLEKAHIAAALVREIRTRQPSGRFLKEDPDGSWYDIGDAKAIKKVGQALREDAPDVRPEGEEASAKPPAAAGSSSSSIGHNNNNAFVPSATVALPQQAVQQSSQTTPSLSGFSASMSLGGVSSGNSSSASKYEPIAYQPPSSTTGSGGAGHGSMGPPAPAGFRNRDSARSSGAAAAAMQDDDDQEDRFDTAFGKTFHLADPNEASVISGLTNTMVSGVSRTSAMSEAAVRSNLSGRGTPQAQRGQQQQQQHRVAVNVQQMQQLRKTWEGTNSNRTLQGSDVVARATMPAAVVSQRSLPRSNSWQDAMSIADASWAEHSLTGGGIDGTAASIRSGRSALSQQWRHDGDSLMERLMPQQQQQQQLLYQRASYLPQQHVPTQTPPPPQQQQQAAVDGDGASVASMSLASGGGMMSLGSVRTTMSDLSSTLIALDLAETRPPDHY